MSCPFILYCFNAIHDYSPHLISPLIGRSGQSFSHSAVYQHLTDRLLQLTLTDELECDFFDSSHIRGGST